MPGFILGVQLVNWVFILVGVIMQGVLFFLATNYTNLHEFLTEEKKEEKKQKSKKRGTDLFKWVTVK